jgi:hypothetical protein
MTASQIEFPLAVSVCAWCKPKERGTVLSPLSHGICLRHLKKLKLEARGLLVKRARRTGRKRSFQPEDVADASLLAL